MTWTTLLWVGAATLVAALVLTIALVVVPPPARVPLSRRRMGVTKDATLLESLANATTMNVDKLLRGRGTGAASLLERAGVKSPLRDLVVLLGSIMLATFALTLILFGPLWALLFTVLVPLVARLVLGVRVGRRQAAFAEQMEESLQILAGSLRAGYSLPQAVATVAIEAEVPSSEEFARMVNETRVGRPLVEAMEDAAVRVRNEDFFWVTQAVAINREVGGNLADVLEGVGKTIRQRAQLRRQVKALSAEGKLSAVILALLPVALIFMISLTNPGYIGLLITNPLGIAMSIAGVILLIVGILWLRKMVQIKF